MDYSKAIWLVDKRKTYNQTNNDYASIIWNGNSIPEQDLIDAYLVWLNGDRKAELRQVIIDKSETEKAKYITLVPGKSTSYIMKEQETIAYTSGERDPVKLPIMTLTAELNSRTLEEQYNLWLPNVMAWPLIGGRIEAKYDYQIAKLENTIFNDLPDVELFISEIDLLGIEPEPIEMPE